jgi:hypothetical protein
MKLKLALAAATMLVAPALMTANAQAANVYVNGGYTYLDTETIGEIGALTGRVGVGFGQHFAVEGEASFGIDDDGVELDNQLGLFAVGKIPVSSAFTVFARAGVSRIETSPGGDDDGFAFGVGGEFNLTEKDGIRGDWTRHDYDNAGEADAFNISYVRRF